MVRFFLLFLMIQAVLLGVELLRPVQQALVIPFTEGVARVSSWMVTLFDKDVIAQGIVIRDISSGFAVSIEAGCNGVEAMIVLFAAMVAFPAPWKHRLAGLGIGFAAIQAMNLLRIITLFYLGQWNETAFRWAHLYIWQALIMLDVLLVFLIWLRYLPARSRKSNEAAPSV